MMMLLFPLIGDLPVLEHDQHTPGAAQASLSGREWKRFWVCPGRFSIGITANEERLRRPADPQLNSASLRFLR